jgi:hypothetical protein
LGNDEIFPDFGFFPALCLSQGLGLEEYQIGAMPLPSIGSGSRIAHGRHTAQLRFLGRNMVEHLNTDSAAFETGMGHFL